MNVSTFRQRTKALTVDFGEGQELHLTYFPNEVTLADLIDPGSTTVAEAAERFTHTIQSWDLEEDGVAVPITVEALTPLPLNFYLTVQRAINEDLRPGEATGSN